jgi:hypothetical protein
LASSNAFISCETRFAGLIIHYAPGPRNANLPRKYEARVDNAGMDCTKLTKQA